ncbi:MAG: ribosome-associated translation inhibitor RaiA [Candidatus Rokubacteria bacterium]|nr:ribosome-associated translation inhibitor RaiA [Candidatus Rokubacteria bacterium]
MRFIVSGHGVVITPAFRAIVERKVGKLSRILPKILEAKIMLSAEKYRRTAELTLLAKRRIFRSEETAPDLAAAVDLAVDALARQVRQAKGRIIQRKPRVSPRRAGARETRTSRDGDAGSPPQLVSRRLALKPMSVEEAVMQLGLRRDQFLVFTNATTDTVNVLYRRKNGGLGLIEPVA